MSMVLSWLILGVWCLAVWAQAPTYPVQRVIVFDFACNDGAQAGGADSFLVASSGAISAACLSADTDADRSRVLLTRAVRLVTLCCRVSACPADGVTWTETARLTGVNQALTVAFADSTCTVAACDSAAAHAFTAAAGALLAVTHVDSSATDTTSGIRCTLEGRVP